MLTAHLRDRGLEAVDADTGISRHVDTRTGTAVKAPPPSGPTPDWVERHEFRFDMERVSALAAGANSQAPKFLLGAAYGDDEVLALADRSFFLDLGEEELIRRLSRRPAGSYGQAPHELASILAWHAAAAERYEGLGARRLDAARPVNEIADELLEAIGLGSSPGPYRLP